MGTCAVGAVDYSPEGPPFGHGSIGIGPDSDSLTSERLHRSAELLLVTTLENFEAAKEDGDVAPVSFFLSAYYRLQDQGQSCQDASAY